MEASSGKRKSNVAEKLAAKKKQKAASTTEKKPRLSNEEYATIVKIREKKQQRKDLTYQCKVIWEKLRNKTLKAAQRQPLITELLEISTNHMCDVIFKHDAGRVIQTLVKYGNQAVRDQVADELKGRMVELATNHYGKFLAIKLLKYCKDKRASIASEFVGKYPKLLVHKDASSVVDYLFSEIANTKQKNEILSEFYGGEYMVTKSNKKLEEIIIENQKNQLRCDNIMKNIQKYLDKISDKGAAVLRHSIVHRLLLDFFTVAPARLITETATFYAPSFLEMIHTRDGAKAVTVAYHHLKPKDRKAVIKSLKTFVWKAAEEECGHLALIKMISGTDDTVLIKKSVLQELNPSIGDCVFNKFARLVYLYILAPDTKVYFNEATQKLLSSAEISAEAASLPWKQRDLVQFSKQKDDGEEKEEKEETEEGKMEVEKEEEKKPTATILYIGCKKTDEARRKELLPHVLDVLFTYFNNSETLEQAWRDPNATYVLYETISNLDTERKKELTSMMLNLLADEEKQDLIREKTTSKMLKFLLGRVDDTNFAAQLSSMLQDKVKLVQEKGTSFLVAKLLEVPSTAAAVKKELMPHLATLSKCEDAGCKQAVVLLSGKSS